MSNQEKNQFILLGSGTSTGIPIIACSCSVCLSTNPKNKRLRTGALIKTKTNKNILIDASPDLRTQLLKYDIKHLDAVVITHAHADHIFGLDDLRAFTYFRKSPLKLYTNKHTARELEKKFDYIFKPHQVFPNGKALGGKVASLEIEIIQPQTYVTIQDEIFYFDELPHGYINTLSFIHNKLAYLTDGNEIPTSYLNKLQKSTLDFLFIDCATDKPHNTHMHYPLSLEYAQKIQAKNSAFIHLSHVFEHEQLNKDLMQYNTPENQLFASYDGLTIEYD